MPNVNDATLDFRARDGISPKMKQIGSNAMKMGALVSRAFDKMNKRSSRFADNLKAIVVGNTITRGLGMVSQGIEEVTTSYLELDDAITRGAAKFPEQISRGTKSFFDLRDAALKTGADTEFTMVEAGKGLDFLAMAGFNANQAIAALPKLADLATVASTDLANASNIASDALTAFGLADKDPMKMAKNLQRVGDVMSKAANTANMDINQMFEAMQYSGPVIKGSGQQIETFAALTGRMANASIKGTKAGTALKNMFIRLQAPTPKATKAIKKLGIDIVDKSSGNIRDMVDILDDMDKAMKKLGGAEKTKILDAVFGKRAIVGVQAIFEQGVDGLREYREELRKSAGTAEQTATKIRGSMLNKLEQLKSALLGKGINLIDAILGKDPKEASKNLDALIDKVRKFDIRPIAKQIKSTLKLMKDLGMWIYKNRDAIIKFAKVYIGLKIAMAGLKLGKQIYDWGVLGKNILVAMKNAQGFSRISAGLSAALGGMEAGATTPGGTAGKAAGGVGGVTAQSVGKMSVLGTIGAVTFAAGAGIAIGTAIYDSFVKPGMEKAWQDQSKQNEKVFQSKMDVLYGTKDDTTSIKELKEQSMRIQGLLSEVSATKIEEQKYWGGFNVSFGQGMADLMGEFADMATGEYWKTVFSGNETKIIGSVNRSFEEMIRNRESLLEQQRVIDERISKLASRAAGRRAMGLDLEEIVEGPLGQTRAEPSPFYMPQEYWQQFGDMKPGKGATDGTTDIVSDGFLQKELGWFVQSQKDQTIQDAARVQNVQQRETEQTERLAKALRDAIKERPLNIGVHVSGLPETATIETNVIDAPGLSQQELGG